jgi:hypothetical protein
VSFTEPLPALTHRQRLVFWSIAIVCALSRFAARAQSLWDWDEVLFVHAMRSYDVTLHHPHPPGFPLFIALGRIVRLAAGDEFRSLQTINLLAGMLLFPAVFMLGRELRLRFETSIVAASLCAFFPNVWFYGGTAFSDVPSLTLVTFGVAFVLRGCRDRRAFFAGVFFLAIAVGIRPQNALVGLFPLVVASRHRGVRDSILGILLGSAIVVSAFAGAAAATGSFDAYEATIRSHGKYISDVDSYRSPLRPPLWRLAAQFFGKQYSAPYMNFVMSLLVVISIAMSIRARDRSMLWNALIFGPVAIAAWLFLDRYSVNRFSIGYCPMFALFAADAVSRLARYKPKYEAIAGAVLVAAFAVYALPAFTVVRREDSPSVLAMKAARANFNPEHDELFVASDMIPYVEYFMPGVKYTRVLDERAMLLARDASKTPRLVAEVFATSPEGFVFRRSRGALWNITRRHYFGAMYATVTKFPVFESGWYPPADGEEGRRIGSRAVSTLPPAEGESWLRMTVVADTPADLSVIVNGTPIETFTVSGETHREWHFMPAPNGAANRLEIASTRDRAVRVRFLSWALF